MPNVPPSCGFSQGVMRDWGLPRSPEAGLGDIWWSNQLAAWPGLDMTLAALERDQDWGRNGALPSHLTAGVAS